MLPQKYVRNIFVAQKLLILEQFHLWMGSVDYVGCRSCISGWTELSPYTGNEQPNQTKLTSRLVSRALFCQNITVRVSWFLTMSPKMLKIHSGNQKNPKISFSCKTRLCRIGLLHLPCWLCPAGLLKSRPLIWCSVGVVCQKHF